jgi:hypothetical protein
MRSRDVVCGVLFGLPLGGLLVGAILGALGPEQEYPRRLRFGDITVFSDRATQKADDPIKIAEELLLTRNERPFLYAGTNAEGKATTLCFVNAHKDVILTWKPSAQPGGWTDACYGREENHVRVGEHYRDIDWDGSFDVRLVYDRTGGLRSCAIYRQGEWQPVDRVQGQRAFAGEEVFSFDPKAGWVSEKTSTSEPVGPNIHGVVDAVDHDQRQ